MDGQILKLAAPLALIAALAACGGEEPEEPDPAGAIGEMARGLEAVAERMQQRAEMPPADPVDFRRLKALLPEQLAGLPRTEASGKRSRMGEGFGISQAEARYAPEDGSGRLQVEIADLGGAGPFGTMAALGFGAIAEYEEESDTGYKRSRRIDGHPGYEEYDSRYGRGEIAALIADRFSVKVTGRDMNMKMVERAIASIDFDALEAMKDEGR